MKKVIFILAAVILTSTMTSCGTTSSIQNNETDVAGYTLKDKKQLMEQKILNTSSKKVIALP
ncbi:hypothetical protein ULMS_28810 [Patiriisocius marinistellae]|uniref:Uncharacterized protein n=1 Tax=Patiriisocius marinistellae TaxID=2494560 RepID=A0A5J4FZ49_9FLAO|nr:hypothetical protein [Patiriisocius marinistellae]GEQ87373.1 hypothetical protein ULMS_28810 [Patiriisocius marinistellae]